MYRDMILVGKYMKKKIVEQQPQGYVISSVSCRCTPEMRKPAIRGGTLYCKRCSFPFAFHPMDETIYRSLELLAGSVYSNEESKALQDEINRLNHVLQETSLCSKEQDRMIAELGNELQDITKSRDSYLQKCSELEETISESEQKLQVIESDYKATIERLDAELKMSKFDTDAYKKHAESLERKVSNLEQLTMDLEEMMKHLKTELQRVETLDIRKITAPMMEYVAVINNKLVDNQDLDSIRSFIDARTEGLIMDLGKEGIVVTRHKRGDDLGDWRVDVIEKPTSDPELDMKVARSNSYGASFRNDVQPMIPESVTVFRFSQSGE